MTEARGRTMPSPLASAPSPAGGMVQQLLRCAPVATWCLVGLGALSFLWATIDNRLDQQDKRLDQMDARLDRMDRRQEERFNRIEERFNRIDARLDELLQRSGQ